MKNFIGYVKTMFSYLYDSLIRKYVIKYLCHHKNRHKWVYYVYKECIDAPRLFYPRRLDYVASTHSRRVYVLKLYRVCQRCNKMEEVRSLGMFDYNPRVPAKYLNGFTLPEK